MKPIEDTDIGSSRAGHFHKRLVNGHCLGCGYQMAWIAIRGKGCSAVRGKWTFVYSV